MTKLGSQILRFITLSTLFLALMITSIQLINERLLIDQYEMAEPFSSGLL